MRVIKADHTDGNALGRRAIITGAVASAVAFGVVANPAPAMAAVTSGGANVIDYGADKTGASDSTSAILAAAAADDHVYFPPGIYKFSTLTFTTSVTLQGAGNLSTVLKTTTTTGNAITFSAGGWHVRDLGLDASANRTSGAYIFSSAGFASVENVNLTKYYIGIDLDGTIAVNLTNINAVDGTPATTATGGAIIRLGKNNYTGSINIAGLEADWGPTNIQKPSNGIIIGFVDVVSISDALIIHHLVGINFDPPTGSNQFSALVEITNCCFDTAAAGMKIAPVSGSQVLRVNVSNTWFGAHSTDGVTIDGSAGSVSGISFTNTMFVANGGHGLSVTGANVNGVHVSNSVGAQNSGNGLNIASGAQNVMWHGGALGGGDGALPNAGYGFAAAAGTSGAVRDTLLYDNGAGAFTNPDNVIVTEGNAPYAWVATTPAVTAVAGTFGSASASLRYELKGKTLIFTCTVAITTNGTAAGAVKVALPFSASAAAASVVAGRETALTGKMLQGVISQGDNTVYIFNYDSSYPGGNGYSLTVSGSYEIP